MTLNGFIQVVVYLLAILVFIKPLGYYMATIYEGKPTWVVSMFGPVELAIYRIGGVRKNEEMDWKTYLASMLIFNLFGLFIVYLLQRFQFYLPCNPQNFVGVTADQSFNTAASFVTNTNWQSYSGETTMSYLTQMLALTVQNFISAATGMSILIALIRGITRHNTQLLGNFWVDTVRGILYILLPLSIIFAIALSSQGVIQNLKPYQIISVWQASDKETHQVLPMGPAASQIAIKQLGTNGGGFFNTNSAHPFENPNPITNFIEMVAILLLPAALCYTFGVMVKDKRQGFALLITMFLIFIPLLLFTIMQEQNGNPVLIKMGVDPVAQEGYPGGNMEGKETRFGIVNSSLWAALTTATSSGSVNAMHDSFTPLGGLIPLWLMHLNEVVFGGIGSGLYGMLLFVILTVFVAGLMVGRTPEYLGKKIEPFEIKMASFTALVMPLFVLLSTAYAVVSPYGTSSIANPHAHGFTEILYAFTSMTANNGSAFAGLNANTPFYNIVGGLMILIGRYWIAIPVLALAGSLARKKIVPSGAGTLPTHTPVFIFLLIGIILVLGALTFFPALALGPVVEYLILWGTHGH